MKPYGLRTRDKQVPKLKGRPSDGLEYEPLLDVGPSHSGAGDDLIGNNWSRTRCLVLDRLMMN